MNRSPHASPGTCASIALLGGLGLAAMSGAVDAGGAAATAGILSWLAGAAGNQFQAWFGSKIKNPPPGAEEVFRNHHIAALLQRAIITAIEKQVPQVQESRGNASDLFRSAGEILAARLGELVETPTGPFAQLRDFNITTILGDFVAREGKIEVLSPDLWQALIAECPELTDLTETERADLIHALQHGFGEALWGLIKHDAAHDRQAFAAIELLYLSRILESVRSISAPAAPPDLGPLYQRIDQLISALSVEQRAYFQEIFAQLGAVQATQALHTDLLRQILALLQAPAPLGLLRTIPPPPPGFTGRVAEQEALRRHASAGGGTLITGLKGMGGIGKTALALVLAHEWAPRFPDGTLFLDGMGLTGDAAPSAARLMSEVIRAFHPQEKLPEDLTAVASIYHGVLHGKKVLLLLDNARDAAQAAPLLPPEGCAIIVTSRAGFVLGGRSAFSLGRMTEPEAAELLLAAYPPLTDDEAAELIRLCAGLPLALRLAASHLMLEAMDRGGTANVSAYLAKLSSGPLAHLDAEAPEAAEISISETLRLSVDPLPPAHRSAWEKLAIFPAPFDAEAAAAIAGADAEMLGNLLRRSLLEAEGADRYKLHDLAVDYARSFLSPKEILALTLAHAAHYTQVADLAKALYKQGDPVTGLALFDRERPHIEAAFHALALRDDEPADRLMLALVDAVVYTSSLRFHPRQRIAWLEAQLHAARRTGHRQAEGNALGNLGLAHADLGDARTAIGYHEQYLEIAREIGDRRGEGNALGNLGNAHVDLGDVRTAIGYHEQALVISREIGDRRGEGNDLGNLGIAHRNLGDARTAIGYYEQQLEITREIGDRRGEGNALGNLGIAHRNLGDARTAIGYYEQRLVIAREIGDRRGEGIALWNSALAHDALGERAEAHKFAKAALLIYQAIENPNADKVRRTIAAWTQPSADAP